MNLNSYYKSRTIRQLYKKKKVSHYKHVCMLSFFSLSFVQNFPVTHRVHDDKF